MKLVAVTLLVLGMLCNSTLAMAESPVPFRALMQPAGVEPSLSQSDANDQSTAASTAPARGHMTTGGKVMVGTGAVMFVVGLVVLGGTAALDSWASKNDKAKLYGATGGAMGGGVLLIVLGSHRRSAK